MAAEVADFYDKVHQKTWNRRTAGFLAGSSLFGACGAVGGVVASFLPYLLHSMNVPGAAAAGTIFPEPVFIATTTAIFTAATGFVGLVIGADVGSNSGSISAGLEEKEKREKGGETVSPSHAPKTSSPKIPSLFNWKVAAVMALAFAAFGALMAFLPATASVAVGALGLSGPAAVAASSAVLGLFGASMGINFPYVSNKITNFYSKLLKGEYFEPAPQANSQLQPDRVKSDDKGIVVEECSCKHTFADKQKRFSLQAVLDKSDARPDAVITR